MRALLRLAMVLWPAAAMPQGVASPDVSGTPAVPRADVVILGEIHDNPVTHAWQAQAVADLSPRALVWEMLTPEQAARVPGVDPTDAAALAAALDWAGSGWPDFGMYHPIFLAAPGARSYGAALTREETSRVARDGAAAVRGNRAAAFGLAAPRDPALQAAMQAEQDTAHCGLLPAEMLPRMVEVQVARDAALAAAALLALEETGGPVVVIAGAGHARRDRGVPAYLAAAAPGVAVVSVGFIEAEADATLYDIARVAPPVDRGDPCAGLRAGG